MRIRSIALAITLAAAVLGWGEWVHWRSSSRWLGSSAGMPGREAIVVLGYGNRGSHANFLNRYRVRAGLRSVNPSATESVLVFCGGGVHSSVPEAALMARYARDELGYTGPMLLERDSMSTFENVQNAVPLIEEFDTIKIVSNSLHAEKGRAYLWALRPDLGERLVRAEEHRFGEIIVVKPVAGYLQLRSKRAHLD
jgi:vancomycin permeability regulator SanA